MRLTVHRATQTIGGNCIELAEAGSRLILDVGRPLDSPKDASGLLPSSLDLAAPTAGLLISHPHLDHYGLLPETPPQWPVYSGAMAGRLMALTAGIHGKVPVRDYRYWNSGKPLQIGPFRVTPLLTDHSAFDAYMLLIEADGKKVLYSGDFRAHGRKASLVQALMRRPPENLDALLLEGTNLGSEKATATESELEHSFCTLFHRTEGRVFVSWSAQNVDRTVTLYRACLRSGRTLVVDLYTAQVLELLAESGRLPRPGLKQLRVVVTRAFVRLYKARGDEAFVERMAAYGISAKALASDHERWVIMIRPSLLRDFEQKSVRPTAHDAWSFSQWRGYLGQPDGHKLQSWFDSGMAQADHIHTSGHASTADLMSFALAMKAKRLIPIHGMHWDVAGAQFPNVLRLGDGVPVEI